MQGAAGGGSGMNPGAKIAPPGDPARSLLGPIAPAIMNRQLLQYDATFGHRFIPGLKARVEHESGGYLLRTNGAGFRCRHEVVGAKPAGIRRVLLFGDSYTAGDGVSDKYRYGDVLEGMLDRVEIVNLALPGTGTDQQYLVFRELAAGIEHDLVLIGIFVENIRRVVARYRPWALRGEGDPSSAEGEVRLFAKPYFTLDATTGALDLHHVPVPRDGLAVEDLPDDEIRHVDRGGRLAWARQLVHKLGARDVVQKLSRYQPLPGYDDPTHPDWRLMSAILERWIGESNASVMLCPIPLHQYIEETAPHHGYRARFRELAEATGALLHDPLEDFHRLPVGERRALRFEHDTHFTRAGHRLLAESLVGPVRAALDLPS